MTISKTGNLVLIPTPGMGHLVPAVELAKQLVARDSRLCVTVLIIKLPLSDDKLESHLLSLKSSPAITSQGIRFMDLPLLDKQIDPSYRGFLSLYMEAYQSEVKRVVEELRAAGPRRVVGLVVDMFCSAMIEVATEFGLPSYVFFTSGLSLLSMMFHLGVDVAAEYDSRPPETAVEFPGFRNPVPLKVWPGIFLEKNGASADFLYHATRYRQAKGVLVNTLSELEWDFLRSMSENNRIPPIYTVGPILNLNLNPNPNPQNHGQDDGNNHDHDDDESRISEDPIFTWLDAQPPGSVVFLCFGSRGSFDEKQAKEIAAGIEQSGQRFLWSLRRRSSTDGGMAPSSEFDDFSGVLPEGFLERTAKTGRVIGWAPQTRVLAHRAIGAFVSHCGWNSTLESLWFGVPMATWPLYAEQQLNAFVLVREFGLAAEIRMDYRQDMRDKMLVDAAQVEEGIRRVLDVDYQGVAALRKKTKEMSEKARKAKVEGGSSYESLGRFIEGIFQNIRRPETSSSFDQSQTC